MSAVEQLQAWLQYCIDSNHKFFSIVINGLEPEFMKSEADPWK